MHTRDRDLAVPDILFSVSTFVFMFKSSLVGSWFKCFSKHLVEESQGDPHKWSSIAHHEHITAVFNTLAIWSVVWLVFNHNNRYLALVVQGILMVAFFILSQNDELESQKIVKMSNNWASKKKKKKRQKSLHYNLESPQWICRVGKVTSRQEVSRSLL